MGMSDGSILTRQGKPNRGPRDGAFFWSGFRVTAADGVCGVSRRKDGLSVMGRQQTVGQKAMDLSDLLVPEGILPSLKAKSKKQALQELASKAGEMASLDPRDVFDTLLQRERLGSTGLGRGIAIPHVKFKDLDRIFCLFARLQEPIEFDSHDDAPVDLIFLLLAPEHASGDHLKALARISRLVREPATLDQLRAAKDANTLHDVLSNPVTSNAA